MTPEQYREKWNLPSDYPMVAPNYAARRSALAKQIGLEFLCTELVNLCARLTGKIDPAAGAMLAYVRDDIVAENKNELQ